MGGGGAGHCQKIAEIQQVVVTICMAKEKLSTRRPPPPIPGCANTWYRHFEHNKTRTRLTGTSFQKCDVFLLTCLLRTTCYNLELVITIMCHKDGYIIV